MSKPVATDDNSDSKKNDNNDGKNMRPGMIVTSPKHACVIIKLLTEEDFGVANDQTDENKEYILKMSERNHSKLRMEVTILKLVVEIQHLTDVYRSRKKRRNSFSWS
ncbi:Serine threonine protein kinase-related domain containing protein [Aphelenchoides besseyi]|nr:Serine threonine protein kinase-related domain containing protein [Aphelenchoides besseyi]